PGRFTLRVAEKTTLTIWVTLDPAAARDPAAAAAAARYDWDELLRQRRSALAAACLFAESQSSTVQKLARAANDFVVYRKSPDGKDGTTILAGYPWFADWGRDTMISLPGLLLVPHRFEEAKRVLGVFAEYV